MRYQDKHSYGTGAGFQKTPSSGFSFRDSRMTCRPVWRTKKLFWSATSRSIPRYSEMDNVLAFQIPLGVRVSEADVEMSKKGVQELSSKRKVSECIASVRCLLVDDL